MSATMTPVARRPASGTLAEVVDIILDKGMVIDAYVRVSLVGIELLTIDARIVIASVDTYLHFAEATNRLDLRAKSSEYDMNITELFGGGNGDMTESKSESMTEGAIEGSADKASDGMDRVKDFFTGNGEGEKEEQEA